MALRQRPPHSSIGYLPTEERREPAESRHGAATAALANREPISYSTYGFAFLNKGASELMPSYSKFTAAFSKIRTKK